jgi:tripartite-type tricarboxylate transporter receptor subunit TctC
MTKSIVRCPNAAVVRSRIRAVAVGALVAVAASYSAVASAQDSKTVRIVVPFPPGGATDTLARTIAPKLSRELAQPVIVENRAGASGQIGTSFVKSATPDGTTYLFSTDHTIVAVPLLIPKAGYDALSDFVAVGQVARFQLALSVSPVTGAKSLPEFADYARANPGRANYGLPVVGGFPSMVGIAITKKIGVPMTAVPYNGSGPVVADVAAGQVSAGVTGLADAMPMFTGGRVRVVAVSGTKRSSVAPDVPTFEELGYSGLTANAWYAFFAPKALPAAIAERFNQALAKALTEPDVKQKIADLSTELAPTSLPEADRELRSAAAFWAEAAKSPDFVRP